MGWLGLAFVLPSGYASPVFPAAGVALACVLWFGPRVLAGVWLGSALLNLSHSWWIGMLTPSTAVVAVVIAVGASLQAWVGSLLVRWGQGAAWKTLEREQDVVRFLLLGGIIGGIVSALTGVGALRALGIIVGAQLFYTAWTWYIGDVLGIVIFGPLTLCFLVREGDIWRDRRRRIVLPMVLALGLVVLVFYGAARWEREAEGSHIEADGETVQHRIADRMIAHREVLKSLKHFIEATPDFTFSEFEIFTRITLKDNPDIFALSFNDLITDEKRHAFEGMMSSLSPLGTFQITERDETGRLIRAHRRPEYVTVRYIVPLGGNEAAVGYDIYSEPVRRDAINRSRASGDMAVTGPIRLVQEKRRRIGVLEMLPVLAPGGSSTIGFAVGVIKVDEMIEIATKGYIPAGLIVRLVDPRGPAGHNVLYQSGDRPIVSPVAPWRTTLPMGDRNWELSVYATEEYLSRHRSWLSWAAGVAGLLFAALLQTLMLGMTGRTAIIQRKNEDLKASEDRYQRLFNDSPLPIWLYDEASLGFLMVNDRAVSHYGWSRRAFLGITVGDLLPPDERPLFKRGITRQTDEFTREYRHIRHDGSIIDVVVRSSPVRYEGLRARLEVVQDITQERENRAQRLLAEKVFDNSGEAIVITDGEGRILSTNPAFSRITGYRREEVTGRNMRILSSGRHGQMFYQDMWHRLLTDHQWQGEIWNRRKNGEIYPEWLTVAAVLDRDDGGTITHYVGSFSDITEQKAAREQIEFLAYHDPLTRLPNRLLGKDRVHQAIGYAHRYGRRTVVMFLDIDNFKLINDTYGHGTGDALLQEVADRLQHSVREEDTVSRLSGDEFLIVLNNIQDKSAITGICEKLMERLSEAFVFEGGQVAVSVSIGIAVYPDDGTDVDTLLKNADTALYEAKKTGRRTYRFFDMSMNTDMVTYVQKRNALHLALNRGELELYYQPLMHLRTGKLVGVEALLRWNHPELGLQYPGEFIPTAEESGLIVPISEWVLREACRQTMAWRTAGLVLDVVTVNLSAVQFHRSKVDQLVIEILKETGLPPGCLELELTESTLIQHVEHVISTLRRLKSHGIRLSIDDFGTGYSSLSYLKRLDVDRLKIDRSFVNDIVHNSEGRAIVEAMIRIARSLNLKTTAEGVEQDDVRTTLLELGCDEVQGFYFSEPLTAEDFESFWRTLNQ